MKKTLLITLFILCSLAYLSADVIPTGYHVVPREVTINNCSAFPQFKLVGYIYLIQNGQYQVYEIQENVPINKGYKLNTFKIYALSTLYIDACGGLSAVNFSAISAIVPASDFIDPAAITVKNEDPLAKEKIVYSIAGIVNGQLVLFVSEHTLEYSNGQPPVTEHFTYTMPN